VQGCHANQFFVDAVVILNVTGDNFEQIISGATDSIKLNHFRDGFDACGKALKPIVIVFIGFNRNKYR